MQHQRHSKATSGAPSLIWAEFLESQAKVRAAAARREAVPRRRFPWLPLVVAGLAAASAIAVVLSTGPKASADYGADSDLFSLTNQDRASNGVASLAHNSTLQTIGENGSWSGCSGAGTINGRSDDMIVRNYFSHYIPPCGRTVFSMMQAYGVGYSSAGENIGWVSGEPNGGAAASYINSSFMNSTEHRNNILDSAYTELGVGSWWTGGSWSGCGCGTYSDVWMFSEEFAQVGSAPPPPSSSGTGSGGGHRNTPAPPPPSVPPATTPPTPTPYPTSTPFRTPFSPPAGFTLTLPYLSYPEGVISDRVNAVLEAYLLN